MIIYIMSSQNVSLTESMNIIKYFSFAPLVLGWFVMLKMYLKHMQYLRFIVIMHVEFFSNDLFRPNLHRQNVNLRAQLKNLSDNFPQV